MNSEIELKYSLSAKDFKTLKKHLSTFPHHSKLQTNYYFDSISLDLKKKKIGLRIRTSPKKPALATVKFPKAGKTNNLAALKLRYEYEETLSAKDAKAVLGGTKKISALDVLPIRILKRKVPKSCLESAVKLGALKTERTTFQYLHGLTLELDKFTFFGDTFYELECETHQPKHADLNLRELFKTLRIKYRPERKSKLARFLKKWSKRKKARD